MSHSGIDDRYAWMQQPEVLDRLRREFRNLNRFMVLLWRLGLGPLFGWFPNSVGRIMVLHHVGRRSGRVFRSPVNFAESGGSVFCVAAFGTASDWYKNLMARPQVEAWLPDGRWIVEVRDAQERPDRLEVVREVLIATGFAAPALGLHPTTMSDSALAKATEDYRLLEVVRKEEIAESVADLAWVWVILGAAIVGARRGLVRALRH